MFVIKRNKSIQEFDVLKVYSAIQKAFNSINKNINRSDISKIIEQIQFRNLMYIEDIQDQIEDALMSLGYKDVAKSFIVYRNDRMKDRDLNQKKEYINDYIKSSNAATGSKYDSNANVTEKNVATLSAELYKNNIIKLNRSRLTDKIREMYGEDLAQEYIRQLNSHELYKHDETSIMPYCVAITMYPFLLNGLQDLGGLSATPKNLDSFCGIFINLCFAISSQFAGALATGEFLLYFDYFARKEWGDKYYEYSNYPVKTLGDIQNSELINLSTTGLGDPELKYDSISKVIEQKFQQIVYSMNQPAAARGFQSIFWNISYFDKNYFNGIFEDFVFPDGTKVQWESLNWLQKKFMKWFNKERTKAILTFPVETMALLCDNEDVVDKEYADFTAEMYSEGHSFFTYMSDNADSLSSCCRLRNEITENQFSYSLGAGGIATGSKSVMTLNINRLIQDAVNNGKSIQDHLLEQVRKIHKYQTAFNELLKEFYESNLLPVYKAGFIDLKKQYLTIGVNGVVEAAEFLGIEISDNPVYESFIKEILGTISEENKKAKTKELMFNTEFVPAESLGVKHAKWDKDDGYKVPRDCYNSYFYIVEDDSLNILDKFKLHGRNYVEKLDGGSALHMNLDEHLSKEQYRNLLKTASKEGTNYFTFNIPNMICNDCGTIDKRYLKECPKCHSNNVDYMTRVIGYLKRISNFSEARQEEANKRYYLK